MKKLEQYVAQAFKHTTLAIEQLSCAEHIATVDRMASEMSRAVQAGHKIMVCGNGGSACQAMHFAEELTGRYRDDRAAVAALCLTDASHMTCVANDYGYEFVFSRAIEAYAQAGDHLLLLSTSGHSPNLVKAAVVAKQRQVVTHGLLGKQGGKLLGLCDHALIAPGETADCIQNLHMIVIHALIELMERQLFPSNYQ